MTDSPELRDLLSRLKRERSKVERVKILARAWRQVRRLTLAERTRLAQEVGVEGADNLLARLGAARSGIRASTVLSALAGSRDDDDPRALGKLLHDLRSREGRRSLRERVVDTAKARAAEMLAGSAEPDVAEEDEAAGEPEPARATEETTPRPAPTFPSTPTPPSRRDLTEAVEVPVAPPTPSVADRARVSPPSPAPEPPEPGGEVEAGIEQEAPEDRAAPAIEDVAALVTALSAAGSTTRRFRMLREATEALVGAAEEELRAVAEAFPDGWKRRRAVLALVRAGAVEDEESLAEVIATLASARDRGWCRREWEEAMGEDVGGGVETIPAENVRV